MLDKYFDEFVTSLEMKEYLKTMQHSEDLIADIIYYAPASIEKKKIALAEIIAEANTTDNQELIEDCEIYLKSIYEAEKLIDADGVFSVEIVSYDDEKVCDYEFDCLFNNFNDLVQYIKRNLKECEISNDIPWHYQAVKWINDASGKLVEACTNWVVKGEVWFVQVDEKIFDDYRTNIYRAVDLNIPVPFKPGDIVEVDLYPFAGKRVIEILEVGDNRDCCCLQALSMSSDGIWGVGAVKHGHIGIDVFPCISPLYTMTICKGELPSQYQVLDAVSNCIRGDEKRGSILWENLATKHNISTEKLLEIINEITE